MLIGVTNIARRAKFLVNDNTPAILTGMAVTGTVTTAYLTGRATFKAAEILEQEKEVQRSLADGENGVFDGEIGQLSTSTKVRLVWRLYLPPAGILATTLVCIVVANKIASKKIAALAVASGISERALQEYKSKVIEKLGSKQDTTIRDEIAQDRLNNHPINSREIILAGTGEVLCYDMLTGRYFQSTVEEIKRAENKINHDLIHFMDASLSEFYDLIGLPPTEYSDTVGWTVNQHVEVDFSTILSSDDRPCVAISFKDNPIADYHKRAWEG